jgi:threonylcarbamoyladenosine tRNA methylthiotransferase MtaB
MNVGFHTLGCKLNQFETESLAEAFRTEGFAVHSIDWEAPLYIVNTCTVTSKSEQKARRVIRGLARAESEPLVVVTGCYAQLEADGIGELGENVAVHPQEAKGMLLHLPRFVADTPGFSELSGTGKKECFRRFLSHHRGNHIGPFDFHVRSFSFHSRAFLKIQDGCDSSCAYCRIPLARGSSVSLPADQVIKRFQTLEAAGYREIVLTGVNVSAYQSDDAGLLALVQRLLAETAGARIRLSSLEPENVDESLSITFEHDRVCAHFHLPIQSGSDRILAAMKRRYNTGRVIQAVELLRSAKPGAFLAGDFLVGFPGESEEDFRQTCGMVERLKLARLHVFPFSPRPGTPAYRLQPRIPEKRKKQRVQELMRISADHLADYIRGWQDATVEAILEGDALSGGVARGVSDNYLKLEIAGIPEGDFRPKALAFCRIERPGNPCRARFLRYCA